MTQNDYLNTIGDEEAESRNRLSDLETKLGKKVGRLMRVIEEDLSKRRALPKDATRLEQEGDAWIEAGIDTNLADGFLAYYWSMVDNRRSVNASQAIPMSSTCCNCRI